MRNPPPEIKRCTVAGCRNFHHGKGFCEHHYRLERQKRDKRVQKEEAKR